MTRAFPMSPLASSRAFLHCMMEIPVWSRRALTCSVVMIVGIGLIGLKVKGEIHSSKVIAIAQTKESRISPQPLTGFSFNKKDKISAYDKRYDHQWSPLAHVRLVKT